MEYFITGTQVYGPTTPKSDLDIVILKKDATDILDFLHSFGLETYQTEKQKMYDEGGFYFDILGIPINIVIAADRKDFDTWKRRTEKMKDFEPIKNREERLEFFQSL